MFAAVRRDREALDENEEGALVLDVHAVLCRKRRTDRRHRRDRDRQAPSTCWTRRRTARRTCTTASAIESDLRWATPPSRSRRRMPACDRAESLGDASHARRAAPESSANTFAEGVAGRAGSAAFRFLALRTGERRADLAPSRTVRQWRDPQEWPPRRNTWATTTRSLRRHRAVR